MKQLDIKDALLQFWNRFKVVLYSALVVASAFYIYNDLSGGRGDILRDLAPDHLRYLIRSEPWIELTADYVSFGVLCLVFWHSLFFLLVPEVLGVPTVKLKRLFKAIDYVWYSLSIAAVILAVHALFLDRYTSVIDRREAVASLIPTVDTENYENTRQSCEANRFVAERNFTARNKVVSFGAAEICEILDSSRTAGSLIYDTEFRRSCDRIGFQYTGINDGPLPYDRRSLPDDVAEHFSRVLRLCVDVDNAVLQRRRSRELRASAESFEALGLQPNSNWFLFLILIASLKMTKTTFEVRHS